MWDQGKWGWGTLDLGLGVRELLLSGALIRHSGHGVDHKAVGPTAGARLTATRHPARLHEKKCPAVRTVRHARRTPFQMYTSWHHARPDMLDDPTLPEKPLTYRQTDGRTVMTKL